MRSGTRRRGVTSARSCSTFDAGRASGRLAGPDRRGATAIASRLRHDVAMNPSSNPEGANAATVLARAERLGFSYSGHAVLHDLSFELRPGLTLVRGGDGRGKTTLLRLLAGTLEPTTGTRELMTGALPLPAGTVFHETLSDAALDGVAARAWLQQCRARFPGWQDAPVQGLIDAFHLGDHLDKTFHMLSTGSRRKVGLVAAAACSAPVTLLDTPFAALDAPSRHALRAVLQAAANDRARAWVVTDHEAPADLGEVPWACVIDLGD